ncbi:D-alanyl-D-alanine carboxypeptidase family protein [Candidatus Uhrbacteria bacterium]|nr:D-alanyl-D-alanine carboxypeptidase family protein [Candidatus Uhrbacteria bacterium]
MRRHLLISSLFLSSMVGLAFAVPALADEAPKLLTPTLSVDIPTVQFSDGKIEGDVLKVNYLGDYIAGIYKYLLGISTTIAIVMVMVSGLQWALGGASAEAIGKAKTRIKNALTGLVLLLCTYAILATVNPNLLRLQFPELEVIPEVEEEEDDAVSGSLATAFKSPTGSNIAGPGKAQMPEDLTDDLEAAAEILESQGYGMYITSSFRSVEKQKELIAQNCKNPPGSSTCDPKPGRPPTCILRDNNPANCPHTTGRALDIWATKKGQVCVVMSQCSKDPNNDQCRKNECQGALIEAMKSAGFCNLSSEAWHFEQPKMSSKCN